MQEPAIEQIAGFFTWGMRSGQLRTRELPTIR